MAGIKSKHKRTKWFSGGLKRDCEKLGHIPRKYGDGIFCTECDAEVTEEEYQEYIKNNPKTIYKKIRNIRYDDSQKYDFMELITDKEGPQPLTKKKAKELREMAEFHLNDL